MVGYLFYPVSVFHQFPNSDPMKPSLNSYGSFGRQYQYKKPEIPSESSFPKTIPQKPESQ